MCVYPFKSMKPTNLQFNSQKYTSPTDPTGKHQQKPSPLLSHLPRSFLSQESSSRSGGNTSMTESFAAVGRKAHGLLEVLRCLVQWGWQFFVTHSPTKMKEFIPSKKESRFFFQLGNSWIFQASFLLGGYDIAGSFRVVLFWVSDIGQPKIPCRSKELS